MQRVVIALTTLVVLAGVTAVGIFILVLGATTDRAAAIAPARTVTYVNVYLQPSTAQQTRLGALIGRLPGFADVAALDEKIDQVAQNLISATGIDYRRQLKPWLGDQLAIAVWPGPDSAPTTAALVGVKDREAAEAALVEMADQQGVGQLQRREHRGVMVAVGTDLSWAFVDELLVITEAPDAVESIIDVSAGWPSLADSDGFRQAMDEIEHDHLASLYLDLARAGSLVGSDEEIGGWGPAAAALVAEEGGLRLDGSAPISDGSTDGARGAATLVEWMPAGTQAELTFFGLSSLLEDAEGLVGESDEGRELTDALGALRAMAAFGLGVDLDRDVLPLLDGEVAVAIGDVAADPPSLQLLIRPDDAAAAGATLDRIADGLGLVGATVGREEVGDRADAVVITLADAGELAYAVVDGVIIIGPSVDDLDAAIDARDTGASLAESDAYRRAFELAGVRAGHEIFIDVGSLVASIGATDELSADARDILHAIGAFALTAATTDDRLEVRAVVTVE